jgi:type IV pilus assembly protein PilQ
MINRRKILTYLSVGGIFMGMPYPILAKSQAIRPSTNSDKTLSLNFSLIEVRDLLQMLADAKDMNLVLSEKVTGQMSIQMKDASWQAVFNAILASRSLGHRFEGNILWVAPYEEIASFEKKKLDRTQQESKDQQIPTELRQIMIEARIVEAERRFARNLGAKLAYQSQSGHLSGGQSLPASGLHGFEPGVAAISLLGKQAGRALQIELSALESSGMGNIISNPRVLAAENSQALIEQGTELPYQSSAGQGATKVQFRKANLRLEVRPRIQKNQMIILDVDINKDSVGLKTEQGFAIDTKHVKTQVLVESGGTVILGGIFQDMERKDKASTPFLSAIPLLGALFRQESKTVDKTELLIFLTPTLVSSQKPQ